MSTDRAATSSPPSGTRDFVGGELRRRQRAVAHIAQVFESHGFDPLETPAFERIALLAGKYGEDEKLIFKIAGRGAKEQDGPDLALRYDLTVPLARFAAAHRDLTDRGFRSYRIGPVWRADRPARGRFREFLQCDVDIVGSASPVADAEVQIAVATALAGQGIDDFVIRLNSRRVLSGLMDAYEVPEDLGRVFSVGIDKLAKIGAEGVGAELETRGVGTRSVDRLRADLAADDHAAAVVDRLASSDVGNAGIAEVMRVQELVSAALPAGRIIFDPFIARGLDYYTGPVFEVFREGPDSLPLSIASGGRYDDLVGALSGRSTPACGGSIGFERIMLMLANEDTVADGPQALVTVWDEGSTSEMIAFAARLRNAGIKTEVSLTTSGLGGQLRYAASRGIAVGVIHGPAERANDTVTVKDLVSGEQRTGAVTDLISMVRSALTSEVLGTV